MSLFLGKQKDSGQPIDSKTSTGRSDHKDEPILDAKPAVDRKSVGKAEKSHEDDNRPASSIATPGKGAGTAIRENPPANPRKVVPPAPQIVSAPQGIAIGGGTVINPTVNNYGKPELPHRRIPPDVQEAMRAELAKTPGKIKITAIMGDQEAFDLASDFYTVFEKAGWAIDGIGSLVVAMPFVGARLNINAVGKPGEQVHLATYKVAIFQMMPQVFSSLKAHYSGNLMAAEMDGEPDLQIGPNGN